MVAELDPNKTFGGRGMFELYSSGVLSLSREWRKEREVKGSGVWAISDMRDEGGKIARNLFFGKLWALCSVLCGVTCTWDVLPTDILVALNKYEETDYN